MFKKVKKFLEGKRWFWGSLALFIGAICFIAYERNHFTVEQILEFLKNAWEFLTGGLITFAAAIFFNKKKLKDIYKEKLLTGTSAFFLLVLTLFFLIAGLVFRQRWDPAREIFFLLECKDSAGLSQAQIKLESMARNPSSIREDYKSELSLAQTIVNFRIQGNHDNKDETSHFINFMIPYEGKDQDKIIQSWAKMMEADGYLYLTSDNDHQKSVSLFEDLMGDKDCPSYCRQYSSSNCGWLRFDQVQKIEDKLEGRQYHGDQEEKSLQNDLKTAQQKAIFDLKMAIEDYHETDPIICEDLGILYSRTRQWDESEATYEKAVKLLRENEKTEDSPKNGENESMLYSDWGYMWELRGNNSEPASQAICYGQAENYFNQAVSLDANYFQPYLGLSYLYNDFQKFDKSAQILMDCRNQIVNGNFGSDNHMNELYKGYTLWAFAVNSFKKGTPCDIRYLKNLFNPPPDWISGFNHRDRAARVSGLLDKIYENFYLMVDYDREVLNEMNRRAYLQ